jgi:hypothetical protein
MWPGRLPCPIAGPCPKVGRLDTSTESSGLTPGESSSWEHGHGRPIVELNDEGEHQVEQVAVLSGVVEAKNVIDGSDGVGLLGRLVRMLPNTQALPA